VATYFKSNLKYIRKKLSLSQEDLAAQVAVRSTTISNWENGISEPAIAQLHALCQFFGFSTDFMLYQNFESERVITEAFLDQFKKTRKAGKPARQKENRYPLNNMPAREVNESDQDLLWAVLKTLREMDGKLDQVKDSVDKLRNKK